MTSATICGPSGSLSVSCRSPGYTRRVTPGIPSKGSVAVGGTRRSSEPWNTSVGTASVVSLARTRSCAANPNAPNRVVIRSGEPGSSRANRPTSGSRESTSGLHAFLKASVGQIRAISGATMCCQRGKPSSSAGADSTSKSGTGRPDST